MNQFNSWIAALQQLVSNIDKFTVETNENISAWNELFKPQKVDIPLIDSSNTVKYIKDNLIPRVITAREKVQKEIIDTKMNLKIIRGFSYIAIKCFCVSKQGFRAFSANRNIGY